MLCCFLLWINRASYVVYNWLETLMLQLPLLTDSSNKQVMVDFFRWQMIGSILLFLPQAIYPVPQSSVGYCP
jgi:hypothetical protein